MAQQPPPTRPTWKTWHKATLAAIGGAFLLVVIIVIAAALATGDDPAEPSGDDTPAALIEAVTAITGETDADSIRTDAENVCLDIEQGKPADTVATNAAARFGVDDGTALVDAISPYCDAIR